MSLSQSCLSNNNPTKMAPTDPQDSPIYDLWNGCGHPGQLTSYSTAMLLGVASNFKIALHCRSQASCLKSRASILPSHLCAISSEHNDSSWNFPLLPLVCHSGHVHRSINLYYSPSIIHHSNLLAGAVSPPPQIYSHYNTRPVDGHGSPFIFKSAFGKRHLMLTTQLTSPVAVITSCALSLL